MSPSPPKNAFDLLQHPKPGAVVPVRPHSRRLPVSRSLPRHQKIAARKAKAAIRMAKGTSIECVLGHRKEHRALLALSKARQPTQAQADAKAQWARFFSKSPSTPAKPPPTNPTVKLVDDGSVSSNNSIANNNPPLPEVIAVPRPKPSDGTPRGHMDGHDVEDILKRHESEPGVPDSPLEETEVIVEQVIVESESSIADASMTDVEVSSVPTTPTVKLNKKHNKPLHPLWRGLLHGKKRRKKTFISVELAKAIQAEKEEEEHIEALNDFTKPMPKKFYNRKN